MNEMKLGVFMASPGHHAAAWRHPEAWSDGATNIKLFIEMADVAERGKMDMLFLGDVLGVLPGTANELSRLNRTMRLDPLTLLSALSTRTEKIGLIATATTTYNEPFHIARRFASLDQISGGRAGWNVVTSANPHEALNFNADKHPPRDARYDRATEFLQVVLNLWDCWEDDSFIMDKGSGYFFDQKKMHPVDHRGDHFSVHGLLDLPRSPQGYPVVVQAGSSDGSKELAARTADVMFTAHYKMTDAQKFYSDVKSRMAKFGRSAGDLKIMPGIMPVIGRSEEEAVAKYNDLQELIHPEVGLAMLTQIFTFDLSRCDPDGPLPEMPEAQLANYSRALMLKQIADRDQLSLRQLYLMVGGARGHVEVFGTPKQIADEMEAWFAGGACDGFNVMPAFLPTGLTEFVQHVIPELQRRGLFRTKYAGKTLRDHLGLPRPSFGSRSSIGAPALRAAVG